MENMPNFSSFLPFSFSDFTESMSSTLQTALLPENIGGTLLLIATIIALFIVVFPIVRLILRLCSALWQVVLLCISFAFLGNVVMSGIAYSATISGLIENANIGIASGDIGGIAIVAGIIIAYFTTPRKMRMF